MFLILHYRLSVETINKTPTVINRKTIFMVARYHGCLVNFTLLISLLLISFSIDTGWLMGGPAGLIWRFSEE
jgi:hypothetical protein